MQDGWGHARNAEITAIGADRVAAVLGDFVEIAPESRVQVRLFCAVLKGDHLDWLIQKSVELGVASIHPVLTERSVPSGSGSKAERWQRIAQEAAEQCERGWIPKVAPATSLFSCRWEAELALVCTERGGQPLVKTLEAFSTGAPGLALFVGPEGGWTDDERRWLGARGVVSVSLGPRILRSETAALAALSTVMGCLDWPFQQGSHPVVDG